MKHAYRRVQKFMILAGDPIPDRPQMLPVEGLAGYSAKELLKAISHGCLDIPNVERGTKRMAWILREIIEFLESDTPEDQVDALCDILVLTLGTFVEMRHNPARAFDLVMDANDAKVREGVTRDPDGYIQKPPGWTAPQSSIKDEWERQVLCYSMLRPLEDKEEDDGPKTVSKIPR